MATNEYTANASPPTADERDRLVGEAVRAHEAGRRAEAAALLERVLRADADHHDALCQYAMLALEAGRPDIAAPIVERRRASTRDRRRHRTCSASSIAATGVSPTPLRDCAQR